MTGFTINFKENSNLTTVMYLEVRHRIKSYDGSGWWNGMFVYC